ncbi:hypothetical protein JCM8202v2_006321 [Rhodotorula sphaerocarpa]
MTKAKERLGETERLVEGDSPSEEASKPQDSHTPPHASIALAAYTYDDNKSAFAATPLPTASQASESSTNHSEDEVERYLLECRPVRPSAPTAGAPASKGDTGGTVSASLASVAAPAPEIEQTDTDDEIVDPDYSPPPPATQRRRSIVRIEQDKLADEDGLDADFDSEVERLTKVWYDRVSKINPPHVWYRQQPCASTLGSPSNMRYGCKVTLVLPDATKRAFETPVVYADKLTARAHAFRDAWGSGVHVQAAHMRDNIGWEAEEREAQEEREKMRRIAGGETPWETLRLAQAKWEGPPISEAYQNDSLNDVYGCTLSLQLDPTHTPIVFTSPIAFPSPDDARDAAARLALEADMPTFLKAAFVARAQQAGWHDLCQLRSGPAAPAILNAQGVMRAQAFASEYDDRTRWAAVKPFETRSAKDQDQREPAQDAFDLAFPTRWYEGEDDHKLDLYGEARPNSRAAEEDITPEAGAAGSAVQKFGPDTTAASNDLEECFIGPNDDLRSREPASNSQRSFFMLEGDGRADPFDSSDRCHGDTLAGRSHGPPSGTFASPAMSLKRQRPAPAAGSGPVDDRHDLHAPEPADAARASPSGSETKRTGGEATGAPRWSPASEVQAASRASFIREPLLVSRTASSPEEDARRRTPRKRSLAAIDTSGDTFLGSGSDTHTTPEQGVAFPARKTAASRPQEDGDGDERRPAYLSSTDAGGAPSHSRPEGKLSADEQREGAGIVSIGSLP